MGTYSDGYIQLASHVYIRPVYAYIGHGQYPFIIGIDYNKYVNTLNIKYPRMIQFKSPSNIRNYTMETYIEVCMTGSQLLRIYIEPYNESQIRTLMYNTEQRQEIHMVERIHLSGHSSAIDMMKTMKPTGYDEERIRKE